MLELRTRTILVVHKRWPRHPLEEAWGNLASYIPVVWVFWTWSLSHLDIWDSQTRARYRSCVSDSRHSPIVRYKNNSCFPETVSILSWDRFCHMFCCDEEVDPEHCTPHLLSDDPFHLSGSSTCLYSSAWCSSAFNHITFSCDLSREYQTHFIAPNILEHNNSLVSLYLTDYSFSKEPREHSNINTRTPTTHSYQCI